MSFISGYGSQTSVAGVPSVAVKLADYGGKGDNATYNDLAFSRAISALPVGGGIIELSPGVFLNQFPLNLTTSISLSGSGAISNNKTYAASKVNSSLSVIACAAGAGNAVCSYTDVMGVLIANVAFDGLGSADYGLQLDRFSNSNVSFIRCRGANLHGFWLGTTSATSVNANGNSQFSTFIGIEVDSSGVAANAATGAMCWIGSTVASNVCHCTFINLTVTYGTGASDSNPGIYVGWSDNLLFEGVYTFRNNGTGTGVLWDGGQNASGSGPHLWLHLEAVGGLHATSGATGIIVHYDMSNGEGVPTIDSGAAVDLWPTFGTAVNNTYLARKIALGPGGSAPNPATDWLDVVSNDNTGVRWRRVGKAVDATQPYRVYLDSSGTAWTFNKPTGLTSSNLNGRFLFQTIGTVDSLNAFWNGAHYLGHTITTTNVPGPGTTTRFPLFAFYSRSSGTAPPADPTDYEFVLGTSGGGTASIGGVPINLAFNATAYPGAKIDFGFGEGSLATRTFRISQYGYLQLVQTLSADPSAPAAPAGSWWYNTTTRSFRFQTDAAIGLVGLLTSNTTPVTAANPSTAANLQSAVIPANALNAAGKGLRLRGAGLYTTNAGQVPTIAIAIKLGAVTLATFTTTAVQASATNAPWSFELHCTTVGTGASGTLECHGELRAQLTAAAGAATTFLDQNVAVSAAVDLTAQQTLQVTALMSTSDASNSVSERTLRLEVLN